MIAGVWLIWPAVTTQKNQVHAATEEIDGQEYAVMDIYADTTIDQIRNFQTGKTYIKFVLQEDWSYYLDTDNGDPNWNYTTIDARVILDLNGHTLDSYAKSTPHDFAIRAGHIEIWDSSIQGTGYIKGYFYPFNSAGGSMHLEIHGGRFDQVVMWINSLSSATTAPEDFSCTIYGGVINELKILNVTAKYLPAVTIYGGHVGSVDPIITNITSVIDGINYETIFIAGDSDPAQSAALLSTGTTTANRRYVLADDWHMAEHQVYVVNNNQTNAINGGDYLIFDLNGHDVVSVDSDRGGYYLRFVANVFELTDTSPVGGGSINVAAMGGTKTVILAGNGSNYYAEWGTKNSDYTVIIRGGQYITLSCYGTGGILANSTLVIAPWMKLGWQNDARRIYTPTNDYYAVSDSTVVSGAYNYEIGRGWELRAGDLWNVSLPADKTYYLWGRRADGAYAYLNIEYRDGQWRNAA